jgi:ribonuclease R
LLDDEARSRGTSVYFPGRVLPMLPERLSNGLCSLNPRVDRLVLSAILELDAGGRVTRSEFVRGVIRSAHRMTYTEVARLLETAPTRSDEGRYGAFLQTFRTMGEVAALLRRRREERGSIDFDLPDADIVLDDAGLVVGIVPESRNVAHRLIEEFMLAANEAVAKKLLFAKQPAIYRVHDRPDPDRLVDLREVLESFGYELKGDLAELPPSAFQRLLKQIEGKPEERLLHDLLLRAQRKAVYSEECRGHYALAAPYYCHFTSPIRRYPDLIVHRQLARLLVEGRPVPAREFDPTQARLREIAAFSSERERRAEQAERESLLWKKIVFMRDKLNREFDAYATGVTSFGVFVTLKDYFVEGLVPISALGNDFFVYEEKQHRLRGRASGKVVRLGDSLRVKLVAIDEVRRRLDFRLAGEPAAAVKPRAEAFGRAARRRSR